MAIAEERLLTLDAMRGVAAVSVLLLHVSVYLGTNFAPGGDLAVDFFFALSGFVIAKAYSTRILSGNLSLLGFAKTRIIRLYPLFFLGCMFGIVKILLPDRTRRRKGADMAPVPRVAAVEFGHDPLT